MPKPNLIIRPRGFWWLKGKSVPNRPGLRYAGDKRFWVADLVRPPPWEGVAVLICRVCGWATNIRENDEYPAHEECNPFWLPGLRRIDEMAFRRPGPPAPDAAPPPGVVAPGVVAP